MTTPKPFETLTGEVGVASSLDFAAPLPEAQIPAELRLLTLLSRRPLIPDSFLLHNQEFLKMSKLNTREMEEFFDIGQPVVSIGTADHLATFSGHWEASTATHHPSVISEADSGREYARALDKMTRGHDFFYGYSHVKKLRSFEQYFRDEGRALGLPDSQLDQIVLSATQVAQSAPGYHERAIKFREEAFSRSALVQLLKIPPWNETRWWRIKEAARVAYARNVASSLCYPWQDCQVRIKGVNHIGRSVLYSPRDTDEVTEILRRMQDRQFFCIDWNKLQTLPWSEIRKIVDDDQNAEAAEFFKCRKEVMEHGGIANLDRYCDALVNYLRFLGSKFQGSGHRYFTELRWYPVGKYLVLAAIRVALSTSITGIYGAILVEVAEEARRRLMLGIAETQRNLFEHQCRAKARGVLTSCRCSTDDNTRTS